MRASITLTQDVSEVTSGANGPVELVVGLELVAALALEGESTAVTLLTIVLQPLAVCVTNTVDVLRTVLVRIVRIDMTVEGDLTTTGLVVVV